MKKVISKRDDGFTISYASFRDFNKIQQLVNELPVESKQFFSPWLFTENQSLKVKMGKFLASKSLLPLFGTLIKKFFPYAYLVILKVESPDPKLVGYWAWYFFKKRNDGYYEVTTGGATSEKYRRKGLGTWMRSFIFEVARKEHVKLLRAGSFSENKQILKILVDKLGWKVIGKRKVKSGYDGKIREVTDLIKEL